MSDQDTTAPGTVTIKVVAPYPHGQRVRLLPPPPDSETETTPADFDGEWEVRLTSVDAGGRYYAIARPGSKFAARGLMVEHEFLVPLP